MTVAAPSFLTQLIDWFKSKNNSAHAFALAVAIVTAIYKVPEVHAWVGAFLSSHAAIASLIPSLLLIYARYAKAQAPLYQPYPPPPSPGISKVAAVLLMGACLSATLSGCALKPSTGATPTASSAAQKAAVGLDDLASAVTTFQKAELSLYQYGAIPADVHKQIEQALIAVGRDGAALTMAVQQGESAATITILVAELQADINNALTNGVLGVKDLKTQATLTTYVTAIGGAAQIILSLYTSAT